MRWDGLDWLEHWRNYLRLQRGNCGCRTSPAVLLWQRHLRQDERGSALVHSRDVLRDAALPGGALLNLNFGSTKQPAEILDGVSGLVDDFNPDVGPASGA